MLNGGEHSLKHMESDKLSWTSSPVLKQKEKLQSSSEESEGAQIEQRMGMGDLWGQFS